MAYHSQAGPSSQNFQPPPRRYQEEFAGYDSPDNRDQYQEQPSTGFDSIEWYQHFTNCQRHFIDKGQHDYGVQAIAAFLNIQLPFQKHPYPVSTYNQVWSSEYFSNRERREHRVEVAELIGGIHDQPGYPQVVSLIPYIRRLVITSHDDARILKNFFGNDWVAGVGPFHEMERRNYLFAAKSKNWLDVKKEYDDAPDQSVPFLLPLKQITEKELKSTDDQWGEWIAMQDWMLGPREPEELRKKSSPHIKMEEDMM